MTTDEWRVSADEQGSRLDKFLASASRLGSRSRALAALDSGRIFVGDIEQGRADAGRRLEVGQHVRHWPDRPGSASRRGPRRYGDVSVVYEDASLVVVNKPAGLLSVPQREQPDAETLTGWLEEGWRSRRIAPLAVHRIDRDTTGLVVVAKHMDTWRLLKAQFAARNPVREYVAVLEGQLGPAAAWRDRLVWDRATRRQRPARRGESSALEAVSHVTVEATGLDATLVRVRLETGRRHQVRAQAWIRGHPLVGEKIYRDRDRPVTHAFDRQALHAARLVFRHPASREMVEFTAPLPEDLTGLIRRLFRGAPAGRDATSVNPRRAR